MNGSKMTRSSNVWVQPSTTSWNSWLCRPVLNRRKPSSSWKRLAKTKKPLKTPCGAFGDTALASAASTWPRYANVFKIPWWTTAFPSIRQPCRKSNASSRPSRHVGILEDRWARQEGNPRPRGCEDDLHEPSSTSRQECRAQKQYALADAITITGCLASLSKIRRRSAGKSEIQTTASFKETGLIGPLPTASAWTCRPGCGPSDSINQAFVRRCLLRPDPAQAPGGNGHSPRPGPVHHAGGGICIGQGPGLCLPAASTNGLTDEEKAVSRAPQCLYPGAQARAVAEIPRQYGPGSPGGLLPGHGRPSGTAGARHGPGL